MGIAKWFKDAVDNNVGLFKGLNDSQASLGDGLSMIKPVVDNEANMVSHMLNGETDARNIINDAISNEIVDRITENDIDTAIEMQMEKEILHEQNMEAIRAEAYDLRESQREINEQDEIIKRHDILKRSITERDLQMKKELNQVKINEQFNFYKVADGLREGLTLKQAFIASGGIKNAKYKLDYGDRAFIVVDDEHLDCCCNTVRQNMRLLEFDRENRLVMVMGVDGMTNYSVGVLCYIPEFGAILLKKDRVAGTYPTKLGNMLLNNGYLDFGNQFDAIALSKTFIKIAFTNAICINMDYGEETDIDKEYLLKNCKINREYKDVYVRFKDRYLKTKH